MVACLLIPVTFIKTYMHVQWHWFNVSVPVPNEAFSIHLRTVRAFTEIPLSCFHSNVDDRTLP